MPANTLPTRKQKGFTLVELLIVIMIIGVLAGLILTVINSQGIRQKSRDNTRIADLKKIQSALELYFADFRRYPGPNSWLRLTGTDAVATALSPSYINDLPTEPTPVGTNATPCANPTNFRYNYRTNAAGGYYYLTAIMEVATSNNGHECTLLNAWATNSGCAAPATTDVCYGVENP